MQRMSASDGRVCFVWVVDQMRFTRVSSDMQRHYLGGKKSCEANNYRSRNQKTKQVISLS